MLNLSEKRKFFRETFIFQFQASTLRKQNKEEKNQIMSNISATIWSEIKKEMKKSFLHQENVERRKK